MINVFIFGYNKKFIQIKKGINSCLKDLEKNKIKYKLCVIFDGHKIKVNQINQDKTVKKIEKKFKKNNIEIIKSNTNKGVSYCRNLALKKTKSKFIFFLDGDDYIIRNKLSLSLKILKENCLITGIFSNYYLNNNLIKYNYSKITNQEMYDYVSVPAPMSNIVYRVSNIKKTKFDENINVLEDFDFLLRIKNSQFIHCSKTLLKINYKKNYDKLDELKNRIKFIKKNKKLLSQDVSINILITNFFLVCYECTLLKTFQAALMITFQTSISEKYLFLKKIIPIFISRFYNKFYNND